MKKNRTLFIYSFLCVSCISFSQLYAARPKFSSLPQFFREGLKEDEEKSDFVKTVLERLNKTNYKWLALKEDSFVALTNVTFRDLTQKEAYKTFLEGALEDAKKNPSAQEQLRNAGTVYLVHQGEGLSYYVGGRGAAINLMVKVSEDQHKQFSVQKQAKRIQLDANSLKKLLSQELKAETSEIGLQAVKEVLFPGENMIKNLNFECIKAGSFFLYLCKSSEKGSENSFNSALNEMFKTIQARAKGLGPFVIGKTETFEYSLQRRKWSNATLCVKFNDHKNFNTYVRKNDESNSAEPESSNHSEKLIEVLSNEEVSEKRKAYAEIINEDLRSLDDKHKNSNLGTMYVLSAQGALLGGLKTSEEKGWAVLSYPLPKRFYQKPFKEAKENPFYTNSKGWAYSYLPSLSTQQLYIKVPSDVGEIFKQTECRLRGIIFSQPACKKAILEDIQGNQNNAALLKQVFGMNDTTHELSNIDLFRSGNVYVYSSRARMLRDRILRAYLKIPIL